MFAGRYVWWMLISATVFLFFSIFFPHLVWLIAAYTDCGATPRGCSGQYGLLNGAIKPAGLVLSALLAFVCTAARIHYLRFNHLWIVAVGLWFLTSADYVLTTVSFWNGGPMPGLLLRTMPQELLFLAVVLAFLSFPIETYKEVRSPVWHVIYFLAGLSAAWSCMVTFSGITTLPHLVHRVMGSDIAAAVIVYLQSLGAYLSNLGGFLSIPTPVIFLIYFCVMAAFIVFRSRPTAS